MLNNLNIQAERESILSAYENGLLIEPIIENDMSFEEKIAFADYLVKMEGRSL